jgi:hypothetical protein
MSHPKQVPLEPRSARVLFVTGVGRSGSTLVSNVLGSLRGFTSVGELRYLWERGLAEGSSCGCGRAVASCPFWTAVLQSAYGDESPDIPRIVAGDRNLLRLRGLPRLLLSSSPRSREEGDAQWYAAELGRILRALTEHTEGSTIVDSSKLVSYGLVLSRLAGVDLRVLHLVRDPRGVAHSWARIRSRDDRGLGSEQMGRESALKSSVLWDVENVAAERLWSRQPDRYVRVRYEDVTRAPAATLTEALQRLGFESRVEADNDGRLHVDVAHTVAGNPGRMTSGPLAVRRDDEWVSRMTSTQRLVVTATTAPILRHYGYPLRSKGADADRGPSEGRHFVEDMSGLQRSAARVRRNAAWVREQGLARALEEKEIDPLRTIPARLAKRRYRRVAGAYGHAVPVYVVGVQRSGTNMLVRGFGLAPEVQVFNENDRRAFDRFKIRDDAVVESLIASSRHGYVMFKPLCDSHRVDHLLDDVRSEQAGRAVWAYRDVEGRVRSALAKFGDGNLQVLREYATGVTTTRWHTQRISDASAELVRSFDYSRLSPASGAAMMWLIRNRLYFDLGLDQRPDVYLVSYNAFLEAPDATMQRLCAFLDFPWREDLTRHVSGRPATYFQPLDIDPVIRAECDALAVRLAAASAGRVGPTGSGGPVMA